jgi:rubrerythrin
MTGERSSQADGVESEPSGLAGASLPSRRGLLRGAAALGGSALAYSWAGANRALAHDAADDDRSDVDVLNFALALEHLENAFYRDGLARFDADAFAESETLSRFGHEVRSGVRANVADVGDHEATHVETLTGTVADLGGTPVEEDEYEFGVSDVDEFLAVAAVLENTGVSAYDGAIADLGRAELLTAGATIATVEARHASYLNLLVGDDPFPAAFDEALDRATVLEAASGFIAPDDAAPFAVSVACDVDHAARVTVTNATDRRLELRDDDSAGVDAVDGRPVLDPGESYARSGVPDGEAVLLPYDPESGERAGPAVRATVDC